MSPKLKEIDLSKGEGHHHPDIKTDKTPYLCKIGGQWFAGTFGKVWYGLNFYGWLGTHLQFDTPGTNSSKWEKVYEIQDS